MKGYQLSRAWYYEGKLGISMVKSCLSYKTLATVTWVISSSCRLEERDHIQEAPFALQFPFPAVLSVLEPLCLLFSAISSHHRTAPILYTSPSALSSNSAFSNTDRISRLSTGHSVIAVNRDYILAQCSAVIILICTIRLPFGGCVKLQLAAE